MKRNIKKAISLVLCLILITVMCGSVFAADTFDYDVAYAWAIEAGFPQEFIDVIDADLLERIYNDNKEVEELDIEANQEFLSLDDDPSGRSIPSSDLSAWVVAGKVSSNGILTHVNVYGYGQWLTGAIIRRSDAMLFKWSSNFTFKANSFSGTVKDGDNGSVYATYNNPSQLAAVAGLGWKFSIVGIVGAIGIKPHSSCAFTLLPVNGSMPSTGNINETVSMDYAHESFSFNSISFSSSGSVSIGMSGYSDSVAVATNFTHG